jgi:hypothetical protein
VSLLTGAWLLKSGPVKVRAGWSVYVSGCCAVVHGNCHSDMFVGVDAGGVCVCVCCTLLGMSLGTVA